jgi:hypothetical protein
MAVGVEVPMGRLTGAILLMLSLTTATDVVLTDCLLVPGGRSVGFRADAGPDRRLMIRLTCTVQRCVFRATGRAGIVGGQPDEVTRCGGQTPPSMA